MLSVFCPNSCWGGLQCCWSQKSILRHEARPSLEPRARNSSHLEKSEIASAEKTSRPLESFTSYTVRKLYESPGGKKG
eukprot:8251135-Pyramimonas_sp.AAC.1